MYSLSNLIVYSEKEIEFKNEVISTIVEFDISFKELHSLTLTFSAIKNPQNYIILLAKSKEFLTTIENIAKGCHNYQERIFVIYNSDEIEDCFFNNSCNRHQLYTLKSFISKALSSQAITPSNNTSTLIYKLVELELHNLEIPAKYIGFKYLAEILTRALSTNFYACDYIDFFQYSARIHLATIDTIERDVRHMLLTTWKKSQKFRDLIQENNHIEKPKAKVIFNAILSYLKRVI